MSEDRPAAQAEQPPLQTTTPPAPVGPDPVRPDPAGSAAEGTGFVQVHRRRAPRYRAFVVTGLVVAFLVSAVVAVLTPPADGYSQQALFGYLFVSLGLVLCLLGALAAVLLERRSGRSGRPRR